MKWAIIVALIIAFAVSLIYPWKRRSESSSFKPELLDKPNKPKEDEPTDNDNDNDNDK